MVQSSWMGVTWRGVKVAGSLATIASLHLGIAACDKTPEPAAAQAGSTAAPTGAPSLVGPGGLPMGHPPTGAGAPAGASNAPSGDAAGSSDLVWEAPLSWEKVDHPSRMRKATYKIKAVAGDSEDAEMSITQVGGGLDANIQRWEGQYKDRKGETKREDKKVGDFDLTIVEIQGTLAGGGMPGMFSTDEKPEQALLAAVVMTPGAPHFFKMTGPAKTVLAARGDFDTMVGTFRAR